MSCASPATRRTARAVSDIIIETFDAAEAAVAAFEEAPTTKDWKGGPWLVEAYFGAPPDEENLRALIASVAGEELAAQASFGRIEAKDWVASSLEGLKPVRAGRFIVHGAHDRDEVRVNDIGIEIEAALAFGTGHHGTTRGCLLMLDRVCAPAPAARAFSISAPAPAFSPSPPPSFSSGAVHACDIDPVSVATAAETRAATAPAPSSIPCWRTARRISRCAGARPMISSSPIFWRVPSAALAPQIAQLTDMGADIILSGLLARDVPGVLSAYRRQGMVLGKRLDLEGWATLLMQRR